MRNPNRHVQIFISIAVLTLLLLSTGCKVVPESKEAAQPKKVAAAQVAAPKSAVDPAAAEAEVACSPGEKQVVEKSRKGYSVEIYRDYYSDSKLVYSEIVSKDYFRPIKGVIMIGTDSEQK